MHSMRSFIAIDIPPKLKHLVGTVISVLQKSPAGKKIHWSHPENLHLTLKFLGSIRQSKILNLSIQLQKALMAIPPFKIEFGHIHLFPSSHQPRVVIIDIVYSEILEKLYETVEQVCVAGGCDPETRPAYPHLTIGRLPEHHLPHILTDMLNVDISAYTPPLLVDHVTLFQSIPQQGGVRYSTLETYKLGR